MNDLVKVRGLDKRFGALHAVRDLGFDVAEGEVLGFLGPNGAGKSTTMKMITGFLAADAGTVEVAGHDLARQPVATKKAIGYLPEGAPLYGDMITGDFLSFVGAMRGLSGADLRRRVAEVADRVHLGAVMSRSLETLSKGFKRRVGIAQAILHDPPVLILDEPTDGLDPNQKHEVRALIREMAPRKAIILSTHILEEVQAVCTRAMIIAAGQVVADDTPTALAARDAEPAWLLQPLRTDDLATLRQHLEQAPWTDTVETVDGADGVLLRVGASVDDLPARLAGLPAAAGVPLAQVCRETARLESVFRALTRGDHVRS